MPGLIPGGGAPGGIMPGGPGRCMFGGIMPGRGGPPGGPPGGAMPGLIPGGAIPGLGGHPGGANPGRGGPFCIASRRRASCARRATPWPAHASCVFTMAKTARWRPRVVLTLLVDGVRHDHRRLDVESRPPIATRRRPTKVAARSPLRSKHGPIDSSARSTSRRVWTTRTPSSSSSSSSRRWRTACSSPQVRPTAV